MKRRSSGRRNRVERIPTCKEGRTGREVRASGSPPGSPPSPDKGGAGNRVKTYIAVGVSAVLAGTFAYGNCGKKDGANGDFGQTSVEENKARLAQTPENFQRYEPPKGARISGRGFFPEAKKTVIFVPEMHKGTTSVKGVLAEQEKSAYKVHEQKFLIIADILRKFGRMPIVLEAWTKEENRLDVRQDPHYQSALLRKLGQISDLDERIRFGQKLAATTGIPAYMIALHVFGKDLPPIGPVTEAELDQNDKEVGKIQDFVDIVRSPRPIYHDPLSGDSYGVTDLLSAFDKPDGQAVILPYCSLRELSQEVIAELDTRKKIVPKKELDAALALPEPVVIVSTGEQHNQIVTEELDRTHAANYLVVTPLELERFIELLEEKDRKGEFETYPDTPAGDCERLEKGSPALIQQTIQEMIRRTR